MKTMLELLIRLQELRSCCERVDRNPQLTPGEKNTVHAFKKLVRECLPSVVLKQYDQLKTTEPQLLEYPELFGMVVLVSTYRGLTPTKRKKLLTHFANPPLSVILDGSRNGKKPSLRDERLHRRSIQPECFQTL